MLIKHNRRSAETDQSMLSMWQSHLLRQYFAINNPLDICYCCCKKEYFSYPFSLLLSSHLASCPRRRRWQRQKSQQKNNDKSCAVEQNWLNRSGFCGLSVHCYKQLVIAINKFRVYPAPRCPIVVAGRNENNKVFNKKNIFRYMMFSSIFLSYLFLLPRGKFIKVFFGSGCSIWYRNRSV